MKKSLFIIAAMLFALTATAQNRPLNDASESLIGVWQQVVLDQSGKVKTYIPYLKIINSDGTYIHMQAAGGKSPAYFNATGKWKATSANTFLEYVEVMLGNPLKGHTEQQTFNIIERTDGTFMFSQFHTLGTDMPDRHETWKKCGFPPYPTR